MQLFAHLLSSYLQGMGDFFSALPRGGSPFLLFFYADGFDSFPLGKVGIVDRSPSPALPKGRESILAVFEEVG